LRKEQVMHDVGKLTSDEALREYCDKNYHQIIPIIAEKVHQEKMQQENLKAVKAFTKEKGFGKKNVFKRLEKGVFYRIRDKGKSLSRHSSDSRRQPYHSSHRDTESCYQSSRSRAIESASEKHHNKRASSRRMETLSESEGSARGHWKSKPKRQKSSIEDDMSQRWVCEEIDPFTPQIRYLDFLKTRMPSHIKTYDISEDPEDHLKIFQAVAKTK
ncbi:hypothetical protein Tco_1117298, partial [Tanacetum coccineum]